MATADDLYALMEERLTEMVNHLEQAKKFPDPSKSREAAAVIRGEFSEIDRNFSEFMKLRDVYLLVRGVRT